jgi:hypothetical protein
MKSIVPFFFLNILFMLFNNKKKGGYSLVSYKTSWNVQKWITLSNMKLWLYSKYNKDHKHFNNNNMIFIYLYQ